MDVKILVSPKQCSSEVELNEFILGSEVLFQERYERIRGFRRPHQNSYVTSSARRFLSFVLNGRRAIPKAGSSGRNL
jgi:hypothetical protein